MRSERLKEALAKTGQLGAELHLSWAEVKYYLEGLEALKMSSVRGNQEVLDLITRLDNHVNGALKGAL